MKTPFYSALAIASCLYLGLANLRGWNYFTSSANRSAFFSTSYRYRPATNTSSTSTITQKIITGSNRRT